jgi:hypothetical protein
MKRKLASTGQKRQVLSEVSVQLVSLTSQDNKENWNKVVVVPARTTFGDANYCKSQISTQRKRYCELDAETITTVPNSQEREDSPFDSLPLHQLDTEKRSFHSKSPTQVPDSDAPDSPLTDVVYSTPTQIPTVGLLPIASSEESYHPPASLYDTLFPPDMPDISCDNVETEPLSSWCDFELVRGSSRDDDV